VLPVSGCYVVIIVSSETSTKQFADRLKRLMEAKNINVAKLAAKARLSPPAVYQWLGAKFIPRGENLRKLAAALDVSVDYLLSGGGYEGIEDRQIAVHESFSLYVKSKGLTPFHPDYEMYERLKETEKPPITVEEWEHLATGVIPIIREYAKERKPAIAKLPYNKDQREIGQRTGSLVQIQKRKSHNAK
jgi:transcriptional regulator with XRE-family HTH domain